MKCIDKKIIIKLAVCCFSLALCGCGKVSYEIEQPYAVYQNTNEMLENAGQYKFDYFADSLCVGDDIETGTENLHTELSEAAGIFCMTDGTISCSKNIYEKLYPASTTKILTAYIALKYGNLDDVITVSEKAGTPSYDSSICGIHPGDQLTLEQALYGLLLVSGNDAAVAIAEYISGDDAAFADLMNQEAKKLGATKSHFVNPHGLHDENHYTCAYDLYLIFSEALQNEDFLKIIHTPSFKASYKDKDGAKVTQEWNSTDQFLNGMASVPDGVTVYGGKTGTTMAAGNCLVLYSKNRDGKDVVSIVLKANGSTALYELMSELLAVSE